MGVARNIGFSVSIHRSFHLFLSTHLQLLHISLFPQITSSVRDLPIKYCYTCPKVSWDDVIRSSCRYDSPLRPHCDVTNTRVPNSCLFCAHVLRLCSHTAGRLGAILWFRFDYNDFNFFDLFNTFYSLSFGYDKT